MKTGQKYSHWMLGMCIRSLLILTAIFSLLSSVSGAETPPSFQKGVEYVKLRLYSQARDTFKSLLSKQPTNIEALFQLANVYKLQDESELAIETFNKILRFTDPEDSPASGRLYGLTHLALSEIYCEQSKLQIAEQHAKVSVQRCPAEAATHYRLGYIYTHQAKFDEAHAAFKNTLARNSNFAEVYEWLGLIALMQHKPQQAVRYYQTAIHKKPYTQSTYYNLAKAYRILGDTAKATEQLKLFEQMKTYYDQTYAIEGALMETPENNALRLKLAEIHLAHRHTAAAIATYQALIQLNPTFTTGYDKLARLYMNLNMSERAIPLFHKVLELKPHTVEAHVRLGWLYTQLKSFDKAESHLHTAIEKMPQLTLAYHGLAEIYTKRGHVQKAVDVYEHIIKIEPGDSAAREALQNLERLKNKDAQTAR